MVTIILHSSTIGLHRQFTPHPWCHEIHQGAVHGEVLCNSRIQCQDTKEHLLVLHLLGVHILALLVEDLIQILLGLGSGTQILAEGAARWIMDQEVARTHLMAEAGGPVTMVAQVQGEEGAGVALVGKTTATSISPWLMTLGWTCSLLLATFWYPGASPSRGFQNPCGKIRKHLPKAKLSHHRDWV